MDSEIREGRLIVKASKVREEIVKQLLINRVMRPSEIYNEIKGKIDTTKPNLYKSLEKLTSENIISKEKGSRKVSIYTLTELGEKIAEELGLSEKSSKEKIRTSVLESNLPEEEKVRAFSSGLDLTLGEMVDIVEKMRRERKRSD